MTGLVRPDVCPLVAVPRGAFGSAFDSRARGPKFDTRSGHMLSFPHLLIPDGQLSATGEKNVHFIPVNSA